MSTEAKDFYRTVDAVVSDLLSMVDGLDAADTMVVATDFLARCIVLNLREANHSTAIERTTQGLKTLVPQYAKLCTAIQD